MTIGLRSFEVKLVPRAENIAADALSKLTSSSTSDKKRSVMVETLAERSIDNLPPTINTISQSTKWYDDILAYKLVGTLPEDKMAAKKLKRDSPWFGIPMGIVMDHGVQFDWGPIRDFLRPYDIKFAYSSVCHPQSNGQADAANKQILNALKKRLDDLKGPWADMVPAVLWSNRTTEKEATGETPFTLAFGTEALLPVEVGLPSWRILNSNPELNEELHKEKLDLLPEVRLAAELKSAAYKDRIIKAYNKRVRSRPIARGDLVLRQTTATR
ncbi:uncharacterized protein LOC109136546 [Beta vulgaris subsp. vulgaris]|uniref:uncharacterized protein LOC109136546 n=1 Tax=Beta vulgaris subsp. vulgaris TaxID=3555 RepID=UPI0009005013|nr:uncharacterized protein LOC109136546 [Beta vulgaris subsp. vulgaris]